MAEHSTIEWTDATWQPVTGCSVVSPGCTNCYAMRLAGTRLKHHPSRANLTTMTKVGPVWNGAVRFNEQWLTQPLGWKKPRRIFVCAHGDLFHESVPDDWIDQIFAVMALTPQHTCQVLTKRSARMREYCSTIQKNGRWLQMEQIALDLGYEPRGADDHGFDWISHKQFLPNVWLGVSTERQQEYDLRAPDLRETPAAVRFFSMEPLLGPIEAPWLGDLAIVGGENGERPMHPDWVRSIRDQCAEAGVPFFFKQWGSWYPIVDRDNEDPDWRGDYARARHVPEKFRILNLAGGCGFHGERVHLMQRYSKSACGRLLDGVTHDAMPEGAR